MPADDLEIQALAAALRVTETGNNYAYQQLTSIGGTPHRRVGAYGFVEKRWGELTEAAGIPGADWRDRTAQDKIAREALRQNYERYGNWRAAVVAFRFGGKAAEAYVSGQDFTGRKDIDTYVSSVRAVEPNVGGPVKGILDADDGGREAQTLTRAQSVIRDRLVMMRDNQTNEMGMEEVSDGSNEELVEVGDQGLPGGTQ